MRAYASSVGMGLTNGAVSHWYDQIGLPAPSDPLQENIDADVCIVGGGLTGLWSAYYLARADPSLKIVVLEAEFAGFGASGRNGGWLSAELAGSRANYAAGPGGIEGANRLARELSASVDEVIAVCGEEGIDADIVKGGVVFAATSAAQLVRMEDELAAHAQNPDSSVRRLNAAEVHARVQIDGARGGTYDPQCARVQPAKLVQGLASVVRNLGVSIYEQSRVVSLRAGSASTGKGSVRAPIVLRCLEGYTASIPGERRTWLPMNSAMIATQPLDAHIWEEIGWRGRELLGDFSNAYFYAQRTADDRIAIGGRGIPYRFGSRTDVDGQTQDWTIQSLRAVLHRTFPAVSSAEIEHAWCGVLAVPRDWCASVSLDRATGLGWAGGYVGSGLTATNLAGRTLRDLVLGLETELTSLPWTNREVRRWEPEPLRWLGVKGMYGLYRLADRREAAGLNAPSRLARFADGISGR